MAYAIKGALRAFLQRGENFAATAVVAQVGDAEPWCFLPFGQVPAGSLIAIDERLLLVVVQSGDQSNYQMAVFDVVTRKRLGIVRDRRLMGSRLHVNRGGTRVTQLYGGKSFLAWRIPDLALLPTEPMPHTNAEGFAERSDGHLVVKGSDVSEFSSGEESRPLIVIVGPEGDILETHGEPARFPGKRNPADKTPPLKLSAHGRWLARPHGDTILATDPDGEPLDFAALKDLQDARLVDALKTIRIHGVQELWRAGPVELVRRIPVRSMLLADLLKDPPEAADAGLAEEADARWQAYLELRRAGLEESEAQAIERCELAARNQRFQIARAMVALLVRLNDCEPYETWRPGARGFMSSNPPDDLAMPHAVWPATLSKLHGRGIALGDEDETITVDFDDLQSEVGVDGVVGSLTPKKPPSTPVIPELLRSRALEFLRRESIPTFEVAALDEPHCIRAIDEISARIARDAFSVVWGNRLILRFQTPDRDLSEKTFFAHVGDTCPGAAEALRRLLATYGRAGQIDDVWADDEASALGYAALALAKIAPDAYRALEGYFRRRDPSHEPFGTTMLLPMLGDATGNFRDTDALRFALRRLPEEELVGQGNGHLLAPRILRGARDIRSVDEFIAEVRRAALEIMDQADIEYWSFANDKLSIRDMSQRIRWEEETIVDGLIAPLIDAANPELEWDRRFVTAMRRTKLRYQHRLGRWFDGWRRMEKLKANHRAQHGLTGRARWTLSSTFFRVISIVAPYR
jgi:hypothetical protein